MSNAQKVLTLAEKAYSKTASMASSAASCIEDAKKQIASGNESGASRWALRSISYSVGICSPIYKEAFTLCEISGAVRLV